MTNKYELRYLIDLTLRLATRFPARSIVAQELSNWAEEHDLGFVWDPELDHQRRKGIPSSVWEALRSKITQLAKRIPPQKPDALARNITALAAHMALDLYEAQIFTLAVRAARTGPVRYLCSFLTDEARMPVDEAVLHLTGLQPAQVRKALASSGRLVVSGLLEFEKAPVSGLGLHPSDRLLAALEPPSRGLQDILGQLFSPMTPGSVSWGDFDHLGQNRDFAYRLLRGAIRRREKGVNILLHGVPGTGKTELCKVLAHKLGASLHAVGEADNDGDEPSRFERLQQLRLGQKLLADQGNSLILFDEMEDLFPGAMSGPFGFSNHRSGSKVHMNRMLENNPVPTFWTTNAISDCDPAFLRRMSFTLELRTPPVSVRARIWQRLATQHQMALPSDMCLALAQSHEDAPALADTALRAARIAQGGVADVQLAATAIARAVRGGHTPLAVIGAGRFEPELTNANHDLALVTQRFIRCGPANTGGLCLHGAPGTGKSAFARYLAEQLHMPVLERRASDLLDRYVGGSERNIADAFSEARDTGAFLIFDEVDSLLRSRESASQRWEVSQVNEMLTWLESHPLPFACTTNLADQLDAATTRRFSLRITFLPLTMAQRSACFQRFFGPEVPAGLQALDQLTPGDFVVVAKRLQLLGLAEPEAILAELHAEQATKPLARNPVGFLSSHAA